MKVPSSPEMLNLKAGEWVEVRTQDEIFATLDAKGTLENLPFMPEMLQYCGRRFRVFKRADKTCDNIAAWSIRRMTDSVHLEGLRCDGNAHGGCQAGCLIFWKEAWLKRAGKLAEIDGSSKTLTPNLQVSPPRQITCTVESLLVASSTTDSVGESIYSCQATELLEYTSFMRWWDPRQYIRDVFSGNLSTGLADETRAQRMLDVLLAFLRLIGALTITVFNRERGRRSRTQYPFIAGDPGKTSIETLDLRPGELVQVRTKEEIIPTLDGQNKNRGLLFDSEMLPYCGNIYRVLRRVNRIVDEKTGKMMNMKYPCIVLEGVVCQSDFHRLCPRAIYSYWREGWLRRASPDELSQSSLERETDSCRVP